MSTTDEKHRDMVNETLRRYKALVDGDSQDGSAWLTVSQQLAALLEPLSGSSHEFVRARSADAEQRGIGIARRHDRLARLD